ncbi:MAG: hypothetical protein DRH70_06530 [Candidatus Coatesbacteria bacterium]|nr:MAG: hypothetical protein DRH70_06530 [Candidatus Coatesbacteria bacterium]
MTEQEGLTDFQKQIMEKIAKKVVRWRASVLAILMLESMKPLNFLGSQFLVAIGPFADVLFNPEEYEQFALALERRDTVEYLLRRIEILDAESREAERAARRQAKELRRKRRSERRAKRLGAKSSD